MKLSLKIFLPILTTALFLIFFNNTNSKKTKNYLHKSTQNSEEKSKFNAYWYGGKAEITSYKLTQSRYGELHEGTAVNIFVTEDFLPKEQVKADYKNDKNVPILKLNSTKKYVTGIYPYSLMTSTFSPVESNKKALKISFSAQEWCGNTFVQLNNKEQFEIDFHSYFEANTDRKLVLEKNILENELWTTLRINPTNLPTGKHQVIPSFEFLAMNHQKIKAYEAIASLKVTGNFVMYTINYPALSRTLTIKATNAFPYIIEGWEETAAKRGKKTTTKAIRINTIKSAYWNKNGVADTKERKALGL